MLVVSWLTHSCITGSLLPLLLEQFTTVGEHMLASQRPVSHPRRVEACVQVDVLQHCTDVTVATDTGSHTRLRWEGPHGDDNAITGHTPKTTS